MFELEIKIFRNYIKKNYLKISLLILIFVLFMLYLGNILNIYDNDSKKIYDEYYYILMFIYSPFAYLSMEHFFRSRRIDFLKHFALKNRELVNYLLIIYFFKSLVPYLLIVLFSFFTLTLCLFYKIFVYVSLYHLMFFGLSFFVYALLPKFIVSEKYSSVRKTLSSGWSDEKLAPFLFAPAFVFAVLNFLNIITARLLRGALFEEIYPLNIILLSVIIVIVSMIFAAKMIFSENLLKIYALLSDFKNMYADTSYMVEKEFAEEKFIKKFFPEVSFYIIKDLKILKRGFRLFYLSLYVSFIVFVFLEKVSNKNIKFILFYLVYFIAYLPVTKYHFAPFEIKNIKLFPIDEKDIMFSKLLASFIYLLPLFIYSIIFSLYYQSVYPISFLVIFPVHILILNRLKNSFAVYLNLVISFLLFSYIVF